MSSTDPYIPLSLSKSVYKKFIEESGILESYTLFLFRLIDEKHKPPYPIHYFRKYFGYKVKRDMPNIYFTREEIEAEKRKLEKLRLENVTLKRELSYYDSYYGMQALKYRFPIMPDFEVEKTDEKNKQQ